MIVFPIKKKCDFINRKKDEIVAFSFRRFIYKKEVVAISQRLSSFNRDFR